MNTANGFRLTGVSKAFRHQGEGVTIFERLDMEIRPGEFLALMGPSGSGKTTLLNLLGGIDLPDAGEIRCGDVRIDQLTQAGLGAWRARQVGFVFQSYNLLPMLTAAENVALPLSLLQLSGAERKRRVAAALDLVGVAECAGRRPAQLSGGQQQRVAIARAIVADAGILLCDEPTGNLDRTTSAAILDLLQILSTEMGKTVVMVTHDQKAASYAGRLLELDKGRFVTGECA